MYYKHVNKQKISIILSLGYCYFSFHATLNDLPNSVKGGGKQSEKKALMLTLFKIRKEAD